MWSLSKTNFSSLNIIFSLHFYHSFQFNLSKLVDFIIFGIFEDIFMANYISCRFLTSFVINPIHPLHSHFLEAKPLYNSLCHSLPPSVTLFCWIWLQYIFKNPYVVFKLKSFKEKVRSMHYKKRPFLHCVQCSIDLFWDEKWATWQLKRVP